VRIIRNTNTNTKWRATDCWRRWDIELQLGFKGFYGTRWFITVFSTDRHWILTGAGRIHISTSHPISFKFLSTIILLFSSRSLNWCSLPIFWPKFCVPFSPPLCYMSHPSHSPSLNTYHETVYTNINETSPSAFYLSTHTILSNLYH
jgi:hypothetical protein